MSQLSVGDLNKQIMWMKRTFSVLENDVPVYSIVGIVLSLLMLQLKMKTLLEASLARKTNFKNFVF